MKISARSHLLDVRKNQSGINMVDLMMWLVIAALLLAAAIQGIGYYQKAAYLYHMKSDLTGAGEITMAKVADNDGNLTKAIVDLGTSQAKWSPNVSYEVKTSTNANTKPYILATHPGVPDLDAIYIFEDCGNQYKIGVNVIPKNGSVDLAACGISASGSVSGGGSGATPTAGASTGGTTTGTTGSATALSGTGMLASWGYGEDGELGNGPMPFTITAGALYNKNVSAISAGSGSSCVVAVGKAYCWGDNSYGQLGTGDTTNHPQPTLVSDGAMAGKTVTAIETRSGQTCAIADGAAYCWGGMNLGSGYPALGDGTNAGSTVPVAVTGLAGKTVTKIAPSDSLGVVDVSSETCVIADGAVYCWGRNNDGTLGNGNKVSSYSPVLATGALVGKTVTDLSGSGTDSSYTYCAVAGGASYCWGDGSLGQMGRGNYSGSLSPVAVTTSGALSGKTVSNVSVADAFVCATASGKAYCWGTGNGGGIGDGNGGQSLVPVAVDATGVLSGKTVTQVSAGGAHACALTSDSNLYCWGASTDYSNGSPILGNGTYAFDSYVPVAVKMSGGLSGLTPTVVSSGGRLSCTVASNAAYCWGAEPVAVYTHDVNYDYNAADIASPDKVGGSTSFSTMTVSRFSAGGNHACAISSGQAYCWGANWNGQIGDGSANVDASQPVLVDTSGVLAGKSLTDIAGGMYHTCALADGKPYCWGSNGSGQLGNGTTTDAPSPVAVDVSGVLAGKTIVAIAGGSDHTCAVDSTNKVYCWGANWSQQLGNGTGADSSVPVAVDMSGIPANAAITKIASSSAHTCVIAGGDPYCWGSNWLGQIGDGTTTDAPKPVAVNVSAITGAAGKTTDISVSDTTCAVINSAAYCWGKNNNGEMGNGAASAYNAANPLPVAVDTSTMKGAISGITVGSEHACAVTDGKAYCWGYGGYGDLGQGTKTDSSSPVAVDVSGVLSGKQVTGISLGSDTSYVTYN